MTARTGTDIQEGAALLKSGHLVAFPTETVYGLGANALDARAVARVFEAKQRPAFDPLIVHIAETEWLDRVVTDVPELARELMGRFWPGPLTFVLPKREEISDLVTSGLGTVGVRQPAHEVARELIRSADVPVAAPSANLFGRISPTTAGHVAEQLADRIDYVLDGGPCSVGVESTVVTIVDGGVVVLRPGGLTLEQLRTVTPDVRLEQAAGSDEVHASPGRTLKHYAPQVRLVVRGSGRSEAEEAGLRLGLLTNRDDVSAEGFVTEERLPSDPGAAATGFFAALRRLDAAELDLIIATPFPPHGLGVALNDRLERAST